MNPNEQEVRFTPLTEGLGFHPDQEDLSRVAMHQKQFLEPDGPMGSGAMSAGPVQFASVLPSVLNSLVPPVIVSPELESAVAVGKYYFFRRTMAFLTDVFMSGILFVASISGLISGHLLRTDFFLDGRLLMMALALFSGFVWALLLIQEVMFKTSLGKTIFNLGFTGGRFWIFIRGIMFIPSFLAFGLGLLWGVFDSSKCCLHDRISGVKPIDFQ